ncbi:MAG: M36 family metallopeptidase, partial [Sporichthyaceae bacterium]
MRIACSWRALVAALSLAALAATTTGVSASATVPGGPTTGTGTVFFINPVQSTGNQNLADNKDADGPEFASAYKNVTLTNLDGTGYLDGAWVNVRGTTGDQAYSPTGVYNYNRSDDRFEQVMAYYWVTAAQKYIQGLGFGTGELPAVNKESQDVRINQWGVDNSYSWDKHDVMRFGKGGVDDAEDAEVIVHEYGHAVHDSQVVGFGSSLDAGSIGEAFGDYLAVTVGLAVAGPPPATINPACVADWDSVSYSTAPNCLRRVDTNLTVAQRQGEVHFDGQIWSRALWDIRNALGARTAD